MIKRSNIFFFRDLMLFAFVIVIATFNQTLNSIAIFIVIPSISVFIIPRYFNDIIKFKPLVILYSLFLWMLLSIIVAEDLPLYFRHIRRMFGVILLCTLFYCYSLKDYKYTYLFILLFAAKFIYIFIYAYSNSLLSTNYSLERFNLEELNANTFGYFGFFAITGSFLLLNNDNLRRSRILLGVLVIVSTILSLMTTLIGASRAGFIIVVISTLVYLALSSLNVSKIKSFFSLFLAIGICVFFLVKITPIVKDSYLYNRLDLKQENNRISLFKEGFVIGMQHPLFGVGAGNLKTAVKAGTHSSYAEIFGNNGFPGLILFVMLLLESFYKSAKLFSLGKHHHKISSLYMTFFILYIFYNLFYWFYLDMFLLGFFFIVRSSLEISFRNIVSIESDGDENNHPIYSKSS